MPTTSPHDPSPDDLLAGVRRIAEDLVAALGRAAEATAQWTRQSLAAELVERDMSRALAELSRLECWGEANRVPSHVLWQVAGPLLARGWLQNQARQKPRGYAGDYLLLERICAGSLCEDPLGRAMDRFFQAQAAPQAVRARTELAAARLAAHRRAQAAAAYRVVSIGSGPAIDVRRGLEALAEPLRRQLRVTLVDLDPEALDFARRSIEPLLPAGALACVRTNVARLPRDARAAELVGRPDFLLCTGLFDYLADDAAVAMLRFFWERLAGRGMLLVGNFSPENPTRAYMEWIGNWYLRYRSRGQLEALAAAAGIPGDGLRVEAEATGIDLLLAAGKAN
jgi:hypothetical protein